MVNLSKTTVVRDAWARRQPLSVHGWVYDVRDGLLRDLGMCLTAEEEIDAYSDARRAAIVPHM